MTLQEMIGELKGKYLLYYYDAEDHMVSKQCYPYLENDKIIINDKPFLDMSIHSLFCLFFLEDGTEDPLTFNRGVITNTDRSYLVSDNYEVIEDDNRLFFRYDIDARLMLMTKSSHMSVKVNNISHTGLNIYTDMGGLEVGDNILLYDDTEREPIYITGTIVYADGKGNYGVKASSNYCYINDFLIKKIRLE